MRRAVILGLIMAAVAIVGAANLCAHREETEQDLEERIQQEKNSLKKAKLEMDLGTLKLDKAGQAYAHDDTQAGAKLLDGCRNWMQQAWALLEASGRDATRKPQGFKDLDIALRESGRRLSDLQRDVPLAERAAIQSVAKDLDAVHNRVLSALFPGDQMTDTTARSAPAPANTPPPPGLRSGEPQP